MTNMIDGADSVLRASEQRFRAAVEAFADALWTNDAEGRMTGEQPGWAKLTGQSFEEYQGFGWSKALHPDDAQPTVDAWEQAVAERRTFNFEHRVKMRSGEWRRFGVCAVPVFDDDGAIREWVGVHRDITQTTEARLQLARNADTFQALVRNNPFGIYVIDHEFKMLHTSLGCEKVFSGVTPLLGRDFAEILRVIWQEPFATEVVEHFRNALVTGEPYISHRTVEQRGDIDATEAYDWRIERIALPDGNYGVVCYFYDLSERVALEDGLRKALDDKDIMVREIDHRVRNSLSIVSSFLSMQGGSTQSLDVKQALTVAATRIQAVARIHERLYQGARVGIVQFDEYLGQICSDLRASLAREGVTLQLDTVPVQIAVDHAVPLGLITNELVTNAFKHCKGNDVTIRVSLAPAPDGFMLIVSDDGAGMPEDFVDGTGHGLGMKVVKRLADQVGGKIKMPATGEAAKFEVPIPSKIVVATARD
ncbi:MAG: histidine kinase dimerization/phosphoacceptor domain -containing protein [Pseudomonadota bacterium]|nr:histidine kinase dimerization/phosphoacceptor domain -containing protein [Pseudomonadota bacterium]